METLAVCIARSQPLPVAEVARLPGPARKSGDFRYGPLARYLRNGHLAQNQERSTCRRVDATPRVGRNVVGQRDHCNDLGAILAGRVLVAEAHTPRDEVVAPPGK